MINNSNFNKSWAIIGLFFYLWPFSLAGANGIDFLETDLSSAQELAAEKDKLFFIYYSADWCMPCKWMEENTFLDPDLVDFVNKDYIAIKADISTANGRILKEQFDVNLLPSILVFGASGKLLERKSSSIDADQLLDWLQKLDRPNHHLDQSSSFEIASIPQSLNSPQPDIHFQRPSLIPEDSPAALLTQLEEEDQQLNQPTLVAVNHAHFTPRSSLRYSIKLLEKDFTYEEGIREVMILEKKYGKSTELLPESNNQLSIILGDFESTGKAQDFLNFLNRNNVKGEIISLRR